MLTLGSRATRCSDTFQWLRFLLQTGSLTLRRKIHVSPYYRKAIPSNLKGKSKSSQEWLTRQLTDPYVKKAQELNYRARSAFKLIEIDDKAKLLKPGQVVVECGAAPGAWTQVIVQRINSAKKDKKKNIGTVVGIDLLPIAALEGAIFLSNTDFTSSATKGRIQEILNKRIQREKRSRSEIEIPRNHSPHTQTQSSQIETTNNEENGAETSNELVDVILSDMAPNASGHRGTDHIRIMKLVEAAFQFALEYGKTGSHFLTKVWDGSETKRLENTLGTYFDKVSRYKPPSSRNDSAEIFLLAKFKK